MTRNATQLNPSEPTVHQGKLSCLGSHLPFHWAVLPFWGDRVFYSLSNHQTKRSHSSDCAVQLVGSSTPTGAAPSIEFYLEIGRKSLVHFVFHVSALFFSFFFALVDETWIVPGILSFGKSYHPCSHVLPRTAACPLPQDDKHTGEVRGTITAHGYGNKEEISTLLNLKHTNMPAPWSW